MKAPLGAVLAGGLSRRMGTPKATLEIDGRPLIAHPLAALAAAGLAAVVVAKRDSPLPPLAVPIWHEPDEPRHPLTGIVHALHQADGPVLVLACDMPAVTSALVAELAAAPGEIAIARAGARLHPLCARYDPAVLAALRSALAAEAPLVATVEALDPFVVDVDPAVVANVNRPEDLRGRSTTFPP